MAIPKIDPSGKFITWGQFRRLTGEQLQAGTTFVVEEQAVVVPYDTFLEMQRCVEAAPPMPIADLVMLQSCAYRVRQVLERAVGHPIGHRYTKPNERSLESVSSTTPCGG